MKFTREKINDMWRAGFCQKTIEYAKATEVEESERRVEFLQSHMVDCKECYYATILKNIELDVATSMGPRFVDMFRRGQDISKCHEFRPHFERVMSRAMGTMISKEMYEWMSMRSKRRDYEKEKAMN